MGIVVLTDEVLRIASELMAAGGLWRQGMWWCPGAVCELIALGRASGLLEREHGVGAAAAAGTLATAALREANGIAGPVSDHNDRDLTCTEDALAEFALARDWLAAREIIGEPTAEPYDEPAPVEEPAPEPVPV